MTYRRKKGPTKEQLEGSNVEVTIMCTLTSLTQV